MISNTHGLNINTNLSYANDTTLITGTESEKNLQEVVPKVREESSRAGLDMNIYKKKDNDKIKKTRSKKCLNKSRRGNPSATSQIFI